MRIDPEPTNFEQAQKRKSPPKINKKVGKINAIEESKV